MDPAGVPKHSGCRLRRYFLQCASDPRANQLIRQVLYSAEGVGREWRGMAAIGILASRQAGITAAYKFQIARERALGINRNQRRRFESKGDNRPRAWIAPAPW